MSIEDATRKFRKELLAGTTSLAILVMLSQSKKPMYGYEIGLRLASLESEGLPMNQGALYPVLRSLEKLGLLTSEVEPSISGPPRRYYQPTECGIAALAEWKEIWARTCDWMEVVMEQKNGRRSKNAPRRPKVP